MMSRLEQWIAAAGIGSVRDRFKRLQYRPGATRTVPFCLTEGYKVKGGGELEWGWARIHTGEDRAGACDGDAVLVPLPNDCSAIIDYHGEGYGCLVRLTSQQWGYEVRIAHMHPLEDMAPEARELLEVHKPLPVGMRLGRAGRYGVGEGRHTHTEVVAWGEGVTMFLDLIDQMVGEPAHEEYTVAEILAIYRSLDRWRGATDEERLADFSQLLDYRGIDWANRYRHSFTDPYLQRKAMRFSTWHLFGGM